MERLGIREADLVERFIKGSGPGGQKINKSSSCVYLLHKPPRDEIQCQQERSLALNRFFARRQLCDRIEEQVLGEASKRRQEIEKIRRQKRRRSRKAKEKMMRDKAHRGGLKQLRKGVSGES